MIEAGPVGPVDLGKPHLSVDPVNIQPLARAIPPLLGSGGGGSTGGPSFSDALRDAVYETEGIISFDNFAKFTNLSMSGVAGSNAASKASAEAVDTVTVNNRSRLGDLYGTTRLPVVWDEIGDERRTPGGGNPDEIMNLIYELKALGVSNAERFWHGAENGGRDHLSGFSLLNQLKLSIMRREEPLLSPAEYQSMGLKMMNSGEELDLYPNGFLFGS